jgi:hypothetical protein
MTLAAVRARSGALGALVLVLVAGARALGAPTEAPHPPAPLPSLPSVSRVRVEVGTDRVLVLEDVALPRGEWRGGDLDLYVAFGAPGAPRAFDARLLSVSDGALEPEAADAGEPVPFDRAPRRPATAHALLGRPQMAGAVLHVKEAAFRRAVAPGGMAVLRVRALLDPPPEDPERGRELVVRLGAAAGQPLTLGRVQIVATGPRAKVTRAEARLCGPDADPYPLAVAVTPKLAAPASPPEKAPIAPVLSVRHASDDLCLRYLSQ